MIAVFWAAVAAVGVVYAGYPLLLWIVGKLRPRPVEKGAYLPHVSILISAYNEQAAIGATIQNKLDLLYPEDRMEVIVVSDGSTDETESIVTSFESSRVRFFAQPQRLGKTAALNRAATHARGEILVFSDANSIYHREALLKLVRNFRDPQVGYVTGKMIYVDAHGSLVGSGCTAYMRYENGLRSLETNVGSVVGVDGGIDAVRKRLYQPMDADLLPDLVLPLRVIRQGYRVVYEEEALLMEPTLDEVADEWKMRVRVILRSFHALWFMRQLFNPQLAGWFSLALFTHKVLRYAVGGLQAVAFAANVRLITVHPFYTAAMIGQVLFYAFALFGFLQRNRSRRVGLFGHAYYFCLLNGAALAAFWKFLRGERQVVWQPRKGV